jgi:predicted PurR-regulated permease PerM
MSLLLPDSLKGPRWKDSRASILFFIALTVFFTWLGLKMIQPYLLALVMGSLLAVLSRKLFLRLPGSQKHPKVFAALLTLGIAILVVGPLALFVGLAVKQAISVGQSVAQNDELSPHSLLTQFANLGPVHALIDDPAALERQIRGHIQDVVKACSAFLIAMVGNIPGILLQVTLTLLTCFFMLLDGPRFLAWLLNRLPLEQDVSTSLIKTLRDTSISVLWATLAAAGVQGAVMLVAFLVLRVPGAFLAGGATFVFAWIPMIGSVPVWVAGAVYLYSQGMIGKMIAMIIFGLFTGIIDNFVRPMVLRGRSELHPLVSLVVIFGGLNWFGITGVFIGPMLASVVIALLDIWPSVARRSHLTSKADQVA